MKEFTFYQKISIIIPFSKNVLYIISEGDRQ